MLFRVWDELVKTVGAAAPILIVVGGRGWEAEEVSARLDELGQLQSSVQEISACNDDELAAWIAGARALLMPSFVEGFGLPVVEALQLGTPVIASDLPVYREIVGDKPTYLDPSDVSAWRQAISDFNADGPERRRQLAAIQGYRGPTWDEHFRVVEAWLAELDSAAF
jgi:glycosyltransferase involved in cell wall biosynthesis